MKLMLTLRYLFKLAFRQLTGFVESLFALLGKTLPVPEFSRLSKWMNTSLSRLQLPSLEKGGHLIIDLSGLKVWRKLHINIDGQGFIVARKTTSHLTDDRLCVMTTIIAGNCMGNGQIQRLRYDGLTTMMTV